MEIFYNDNHVDSLDLPEGFGSPETFISADYTKKMTIPSIALNKGSGHASTFLLYLNGQTNYNILSGQNGTAFRVKYTQLSGPPYSGATDATYRYLFPYRFDMRGDSVVYADSIKTPIVDQRYNFCSGIRHDIYIDGELIINYDASYCNSNFFMGQGSKITIQPGKIVRFENCNFRTCDTTTLWQGIVLESGAQIFVTGKSKFYNANTAIKGLDNATIQISHPINLQDKIEFHKCTEGIVTKNGGDLDVANCFFNKPHVAIDIYNQGGDITSSEFTSNSGGYGIRSVQPGTPYTVSISKNCKFKDHLRSIFARNTRLSITQTTFDDVYMPILITDVPNISHNIQNSVFFRNTKFDGLTVNNSTSHSPDLPSNLHWSHFIGGRQNGVRLYNVKRGWDIQNSNFTNNRTGIHIVSSNDVNVKNSYFDFNLTDRAFSSNMNFIRISSSNNNLIGRNNSSTNYFTISSEAYPNDIYRHIFLDNSGMNNRILCNEFTGGNRGINPWGPCMSEIAGSIFNDVKRGLYYGLQSGDTVTLTGIQEFKNNVWNLANPNSDIGATHLGASINLVRLSQYLVHSDSSIHYPVFEAVDEEWFRLDSTMSPYNCNTGFTGGGAGNGIFQMMTTGGGFGSFPFTAGMNAAAQDFIYDAIIEGETFGESSGTVASYLDTLLSNADLYHVKEAEKLMYATGTNQSGIETRYEAHQDALDEYYTLDSTATEEIIDSIKLVISQLETAAQTLYNTYKVELDTNLILARAHLEQVSNTRPYWYNKARVLDVLIQKWQGEDPDSSQMAMLEDIANQCPFEGGKGVYMARGILSEYILEEVIYDDLAKCDSLIPRTIVNKISTLQIYPNPAKSEFVIESNKQLSSIQIFDITGKLMYQSNSLFDKKAWIQVQDWPVGIYFVQVKIKDESKPETKKVIVIP